MVTMVTRRRFGFVEVCVWCLGFVSTFPAFHAQPTHDAFPTYTAFPTASCAVTV